MGTFPRDRLPNVGEIKHDAAFVINSAQSHEKEGHWLLVYFNAQSKTTVWFDSLGNLPSYYGKNLFLWLHAPGFKVDYSTKPVQAINSRLCGLFVLFVLYYLSRGLTLERILSYFNSRDLGKNDKLVSLFAWKKFRFNAYKEISE